MECEHSMWDKIKYKFEKYPARMRLARKIVELGLRIGENGKIYCGDIEISDVSIARAAHVDRRSIKSTVDIILQDQLLAKIFANISPAGPLVKNVATDLGFGIVEIEADASNPGIIAHATELIAKNGISIRQVHAGDPEIEENPRLIIITQKPIGGLINQFLKIEGVKRVSIY